MNTHIYVLNKYSQLYHSIITNAISKKRYKSKNYYYENHHIIPRSFYGSNESDNLVLLTAREHYICHYLLTKFTINNYQRKMASAFHLMNGTGRYKINSKLYESNKILKSKLGQTKQTKLKISISNTGKIRTQQHKEQISIANTGKNSYAFKGYYITPWGKFESSKLASTDLFSFQNICVWCKNPDVIITTHSHKNSKYLKSLNVNHIGKTRKELGFDFQFI